MTDATNPHNQSPGKVRRWVQRGFLLWAVFSSCWLANSIRTQGVDDITLQSDYSISVSSQPFGLEFLPNHKPTKNPLVFICGSGITPQAYAPLLRPIANEGHPVFVVELPFRFAPLETHKLEAIERVRLVIQQHPELNHWVLAGHSLGGALACRAVQTYPQLLSGVVLIATTHPKDADLSTLMLPVMKIYATNDGIAPQNRIFSNKSLLPQDTTWTEIKGGNHSQFGHYGHQLFDGAPTIGRKEQQELTRSAILSQLTKSRKVT